MHLKEHMEQVNEVSHASQDDHCCCHRPIQYYALIILVKDSDVQIYTRCGSLFVALLYLYTEGYTYNFGNED